MGLHYLVRRQLDHFIQDWAPLTQIPSSIMHGMKAPSSPVVYELCSTGCPKNVRNHQVGIFWVCEIET